MMNELRKLLKCPLDWFEVTNHPFEGSILEADWQYAVGAMAVDPDDIPFDEDWIDVDFDEDEIVHAVDVLRNRRDETRHFYETKCAYRLYKLDFKTPAEHGKHFIQGLDEARTISRTKHGFSLFLRNLDSEFLRQRFWDWVIRYFDIYSDRDSYRAMMDPDEEDYNEEKAKLWRNLLSKTHSRLCWRFNAPIGASNGELTSFICYDVHIDTEVVHCYPVTETQAGEIMGDAELVNSDDYFRPENL
jgi:hypothetical protein